MSSEVLDPIAVIGSSCRFAGGINSPTELWKLVQEPRDIQTRIPDSRFSTQGFYHVDGQYHGHTNVNSAYLLDQNVVTFDARFFSIKPIEAKAMDPQQRLLLEVVYEKTRGTNTGVYIGQMSSDYEILQLRDTQALPQYHTLGTQRTIDTACSSSLVAIHLASQALRSGDARQAIACGTNLLLGPEHFIGYSKLMMLSSDGKSKMWDQDANGYARGEGVAALVLKTLKNAIEDGDHIECILRATGINQDGSTKGITVPNPQAQAALICDTYRKAGLDPYNPHDHCQYFEVRGTGTRVGDSVEAEAIRSAFFPAPEQVPHHSAVPDGLKVGPLYVGSIKTLLGHTEGAAGIASILKASLAVQHGIIPANLNFNTLSDRVAPFCENLEVPTSSLQWPPYKNGQTTRRVSVNSFRFGGTNAHVIVENYQKATKSNDGNGSGEDTATLIPFSASSKSSLSALLEAYRVYLDEQPTLDIHKLASTLRNHRSSSRYKVIFRASSINQLRDAIASHLQEGASSVDGSLLDSGRILAIFTGQGAQYARMGAELLQQSPFARRFFETLEGHLSDLPPEDRPSWSLTSELLAGSSTTRMHQAEISQPVCTAVQILLVDILRAAKVAFAGVVGHSSGEIGAAYAAGYVSKRDTIVIAYYRGIISGLASNTSRPGVEGAMLALGTSMNEAREICERSELAGRIVVAACNSPTSVTLSGDNDAIELVESLAEERGIFRRRLRVDKAYHSHHMIPCAESYKSMIRKAGVQAGKQLLGCTWYSSVVEKEFGSTLTLTDDYWASNMTDTVLFNQAIHRAWSSGTFQVAVELGPHPALKGPTMQTIQDMTPKIGLYQGMLSRGSDAMSALLDACGTLWTHKGSEGISLDDLADTIGIRNVGSPLKGLPTYCWDHDCEIWHETRISRALRQRNVLVHPLLGDHSPLNSSEGLTWRNLLRINELPWIAEHRMQRQIVFPAAGYISSALEASLSLATKPGSVKLIELYDFRLHHPLVFDEDDEEGIEVSVSLSSISRLSSSRIKAHFSYAAGIEKNCCDLTLLANSEVEILLGEPSDALLGSCQLPKMTMFSVDSDRFYSNLQALGYSYDGPFRKLSLLHRALGNATGTFEAASGEDANPEGLLLHPAFLDNAIQSTLLAYSYPGDGRLRTMHIPTSALHIRLDPTLCDGYGSNFNDLSFYSKASRWETNGVLGDIQIYGTDTKRNIIQIEGLKLVSVEGLRTKEDDKELFAFMKWDTVDPIWEQIMLGDTVDNHMVGLSSYLERLSCFYLKQYANEFPPGHSVRSKGHHRSYLHYAQACKQINQIKSRVQFDLIWIQEHNDLI
ncbi:ketoacyl-synt-domain-containing protein [Xylaria sp. FL0064]|nr:ketoacyl-synt-domain-containing protein [Xylaria sp. FL0064]